MAQAAPWTSTSHLWVLSLGFRVQPQINNTRRDRPSYVTYCTNSSDHVSHPQGVDNGDQVQMEVSLGPRQKMRVAVPIEVEPHPVFRREGLDILSAADLTLTQALMGATVVVQTIEGTAELQVPPCTNHGSRLRMRAKGVVNHRAGGRGDQLVEVRVIMPRNLTARQQQLLREFEAEEAGKRGSRGNR